MRKWTKYNTLFTRATIPYNISRAALLLQEFFVCALYLFARNGRHILVIYKILTLWPSFTFKDMTSVAGEYDNSDLEKNQIVIEKSSFSLLNNF